MKRVLKIAALSFVIIAVVGAAAGLIYWNRLTASPQYSLALLIDAARRDDKATVDKLINMDAVVDSFVPQVREKAIELYGRGLPRSTVDRLALIADPLMPAVKQRARDELPRIMAKETERFAEVPFAAMVLGADRYLEISVERETALIRSKLPQHSFEVTMRRRGDHWQIVAVRDDKLAALIAQTIGEQLIGIATKGDLKKAGEFLGTGELQEMVRQVEDLFR